VDDHRLIKKLLQLIDSDEDPGHLAGLFLQIAHIPKSTF